MSSPLITVVVPSFQQGAYLETALTSILEQQLPIEILVLDGGSRDQSQAIIQRFAPQLAFWRSHPDQGQTQAINEGISKGTAPYVAWLNSDDWLLPNGLSTLVHALESNPTAPMAYGRVWNIDERSQHKSPIWVEDFREKRLALRCILSQPGTLIRRSVWERVRGLNESLHMAMDYDLWWRIYKQFGPPLFVNAFVAVNREHPATKTNTKRALHYQEAIQVVRQYYGKVPLKWWLYQPYAIWFKAFKNYVKSSHRSILY